MLEGSCHCGAVRWTFDGVPESATACNCTICRRYGCLWAYDFEGERIRVSGPTRAYMWGSKSIGYNFCATCGCVVSWREERPGPEGRIRVAFNLRLAEPDAVGSIVIEHFDDLKSFDDLGQDGRCVRDMWF